MKIDSPGIILEPRALASDDDPKNGSESSDDEGIFYSRRDSNESTVSNNSVSTENSEIDEELSKLFHSTLKVEKLADKLEENLKVATEEDLRERTPIRNNSGRAQRSNAAPYPENQNADHRIINLYSGGSLQEPEPPALSAEEVSDFFNNLERAPPPKLPEPNFTVRQTSPTFPAQNSPLSDYGYFSSDRFSPQSCTSYDTETSAPVGSPSNSLSELPKTLPHLSDEEVSGSAVKEMRDFIDRKYKDTKKHEWIIASSKEDIEELFSELRKSLSRETRLTPRCLVRIYATIAQILIRDGDLKSFFMQETQLLHDCVMKNDSLLIRYIVETMQDLELSPETIGLPLVYILKSVIEQDLDMRQTLNTLLSLKAKNNLPIFDLSETDHEGYTPIHRVLIKISSSEQQERNNIPIEYLKICLDHKPDFTICTLKDGRSYLHHAVDWRCGPEAVDLILRFCNEQNPNNDLIHKIDANGDSVFTMVATLTQNRREMQEVLSRYQPYDGNELSDHFNNC